MDEPIERTSLLLKIDDKLHVSYIPLVKYGNGIRMACGEKKNEIMESFFKRSKNIQKENFVAEEYARFAEEKVTGYMLACSGYYDSFWKRLLNRFSGYRLTKFFARNKKKLALRNYIECEAHRELWLKGLQP